MSAVSLSLPFSILIKLRSCSKSGKGAPVAGFTRTHEQLCALPLHVLLPLKLCITESDANSNKACIQGDCHVFIDRYIFLPETDEE